MAHDFNKMLTVLGGCTELLDRSLPEDSRSRQYLDQILRTIDKATAVTGQLLTFSRKQILDLHLMDLHEALTESEFMLPRLSSPAAPLNGIQESALFICLATLKAFARCSFFPIALSCRNHFGLQLSWNSLNSSSAKHDHAQNVSGRNECLP